jgi:hypothetical protein
VDSSTALRYAIMSVPVPGAPPRQNAVGAAIGLSFLDSALRLNHIRRVSETLTVTDHRVARRTTEIDISLAMLDEGQRRAMVLSRDLRSASRHREDGDQTSDEVWVPVARIARRSTAPVSIWDPSGARLPRLTQNECGRLLAAGLFRLLRGILDSLPGTTTDSELHLLLHRVPEAEWLLQHAIDILVTERHRPPAGRDRPREAGVVAGQGARYRAIALAVLDKHEHTLAEFFELLDVALDNDLLIVALDPARDEHVLTYETPLHVTSEEDAGHRFARLLRSSAEGYHLQYRSSISSSIPAYHLVVEAEPGVDIARMYLSTDADARIAAALRADLLVLAARLENERRAPTGRASSKILELQMQTTLRTLADLVRRRRWEAAQAGVAVPAHRMAVSSELGHVAVSGEGTAGPDGAVDSSVLRHPALQPERLRAAAEELFAEELYAGVALENDPSPSRAHASWHGCSAPGATTGAPVEIRAGMLMRDTTAAGPRRVCQYAVLVAVVGFLFAVFLAGSPWPFDAASRARLGAIADAGAVISVLLLVPGFLYTRLGLSDRRSISGRLRALPRAVANVCIGVIAVVAGTVASGLSGGWVQLAFATMVAVPLAAATLLLYRRRPESDTAELVRLGAPHWLDGADVGRVRADAQFFSVLGGAR